ncbi:MAG: Bax inhibitor-1/YccA family protein [Bacteroidales bacterium]|nr:Bax inhibitor-1/YccA family protein [Bacteroidales bacterium]
MDENQILYRNDATEAECNAMLRKVYLWMCAALVITGLVAYYVSNSYMILSYIYSSKWVLWTIIFGEFGLVIGLSAAINRISATAATLMFILYALLNGLLMSSIFMVYSISSIGTTFFVTAGTFGAMAVYGSVTKKDLTKLGSLLLMALIGLIIATLVNLFLKNGVMDMVISGIGVLVFVGLTAYDAQKIKGLLYGAVEEESTNKLAVLGALSLYLDFINLFLYLLRFLGRRK